MQLRWLIIVVVGVVLLAACGSSDPTPTSASTPTPTPAPVVTPSPTPTQAPVVTPSPTPTPLDTAEELIMFNGCSGCHTIDPIPEARGLLGPDLTHIGSRADAAYIRESIIDPRAVIATGCPGGACGNVMPTTFADSLSEQEIDRLVEYLVGLD